MNLRQRILGRVPFRFHLPLRYWSRFLTGRLEKELPVVLSMIPRGRVCLDIGANKGLYTYALSRISKQVEAFEPLPDCARTLRAFGARNIHVHEVALSSTT